jgi:hypothetical protein
VAVGRGGKDPCVREEHGRNKSDVQRRLVPESPSGRYWSPHRHIEDEGGSEGALFVFLNLSLDTGQMSSTPAGTVAIVYWAQNWMVLTVCLCSAQKSRGRVSAMNLIPVLRKAIKIPSRGRVSAMNLIPVLRTANKIPSRGRVSAMNLIPVLRTAIKIPASISFSIRFILEDFRDRLYGVVVRLPGCRQRGPGFDFRRHQILCASVGLGRGPLSLPRINEEVLERKVAAPV